MNSPFGEMILRMKAFQINRSFKKNLNGATGCAVRSKPNLHAHHSTMQMLPLQYNQFRIKETKAVLLRSHMPKTLSCTEQNTYIMLYILYMVLYLINITTLLSIM